MSKGFCAKCDSAVPERTEKKFGNMIISNIDFEPTSVDETFANNKNCQGLSKRRPDISYIIPGRVSVVIEIDEDSHHDRIGSCEVAKLSEQNEAIRRIDNCNTIPCYTIRVNPDSYDRRIVKLSERAKTVSQICQKLLNEDNHQSLREKVIFCFYHSKSEFLIEETRKYFEVEIY
tara:strand:- start:62 stop:586 length:525 start_codon:yes stop_codon:yes gene_type:complete